MTGKTSAAEQKILLLSIFVVSLCGIIYELVLGSLATYLLGDPVVQYSITIGFFLSSMGIGSFISRFVQKNLVRVFVMTEVLLGLFGGISVLTLNYMFSFSRGYYFLHVFFLMVIGALVGMEIPLLTRILKQYGSLKTVISNVLSIDYIGGLAGSLLFPLILFPVAGRFVTSLVIGIVNLGVAFIVVVFVSYERKRITDYFAPVIAACILIFALAYSGEITKALQSRLYADDIVFSKRSKYQEIVLTRDNDDFRLFLDGSIQFSTSDEYRYHEMLVHPPLDCVPKENKNILVMGGGDGLAVRELLTRKDVAHITLVELDPLMIDLATKNGTFLRINKGSLLDKRVNVVIGDAFTFCANHAQKQFDVIIADFSDPHDETISKLYSVEFYRLVKHVLSSGGVFITQSTSPLFAREAFWCIERSAAAVFAFTLPYHINVPSFGDWGFVVAADFNPLNTYKAIDQNMRFYTEETFMAAQHFEKDDSMIPVKVSTFDMPVVYRYYIKGWKYAE